MTGRRLKNLSLLVSILLSGATLLAWTGQWFELHLKDSGAAQTSLSIAGSVAAPGLIALALAGLALAAALAIAGPVFRWVLGVLQLLIGFTVGLSSILAAADPVGSSASAITTATGVSGKEGVAALVDTVAVSGWPVVAAVIGGLTMLLGVFVLVTGSRWPGSSRRYQSVRLEPAEKTENRVSDWDSLSGGQDPT